MMATEHDTQLYEEIKDGIFRSKRELYSILGKIANITHRENREWINSELKAVYDGLERTFTFIKSQQ